MSDWTAGYVADVSYTHGFYRELTPTLLNFAVLARGKGAPDSNKRLDYCELGCGQGLSMNLLAAANPNINFYANDFNPAQIAGARALAAEAGLENVTFFDTSFAEFVHEPSLPESFDIISLHGIYSWINAENRAAIVDFLRRKLKVGGVVYISYNALPGWAAMAPLRHLMHQYGKVISGTTMSRIEFAFAEVEKIHEANAGYFRSVPGFAERLDRLKSMSRNYIAHEYFNDVWELFYHSQVVSDLDAAKLTFVGSASLLEQVDAINLTGDQQRLLAEVHDPVMKETMRDYMLNQQFRRDIFMKGPVSLSPSAVHSAWLDQRLVLARSRSNVAMTVKVAVGEASLSEAVYGPILDGMLKGPQTMRELLANEKISALGAQKIQQAIMVLVGAGHLEPCLSAKDESKRARSTKAFNKAVIQRAKESVDIQYMASPVTGGGISVGRFQQLFLLALESGRKEPSEWADFAWKILTGQGQRIVKDGKTIENEEDNLAELNSQALIAAEKLVPVLRSLQIA